MIMPRGLLLLPVRNLAGVAATGKAITGKPKCSQKCVSDDLFPGNADFFSAMPEFPRARIAS